jgi:Tfp pilus assembly protein PilF
MMNNMRVSKSWRFTLIFILVLASGCSSTPKAPEPQVVIKSEKELSQSFEEMGTQALLRGEYAMAIEDFNNALAKDSKNLIAINHLGIAYHSLGKKELAKKQFLRAAAVDSTFSDAYVNLAKLSLDENDLKSARKYYNQALENLAYKTRHRALTGLAQVAFLENNIDEARILLHRSISMNPDYCLSHFLMGSIYMRDGKNTQAVGSFKKSVLSTCTSNIEGHYLLGLAYLKNKDFSKARSKFVYLLEQFPESEQAKKASENLRMVPQ